MNAEAIQTPMTVDVKADDKPYFDAPSKMSAKNVSVF